MLAGVGVVELVPGAAAADELGDAVGVAVALGFTLGLALGAGLGLMFGSAIGPVLGNGPGVMVTAGTPRGWPAASANLNSLVATIPTAITATATTAKTASVIAERPRQNLTITLVLSPLSGGSAVRLFLGGRV